MRLNQGSFRIIGLAAALAASALIASPPASAAERVIKSGETLLSIAKAQTAAYPDATLSQIAWALVRSNPEAFPTGPGKLQGGARLLLPSASTVADTSPEVAAQKLLSFYNAYAQTAPAPLRPAPAKSSQAAAPAPAAPPAVAPAPAAPPATPKRTVPAVAATQAPVASAGRPSITDIELLPTIGGEARQWLAVTGTGFAQGALLEFFSLARKHALAARVPASVTATRIEYQGRFGEQPSRWRVTVRNPGGAKSEAFEFEAGRNIARALPAAATAPEAVIPATPPATSASAFRTSTEAQALPTDPAQRYQQLAALEERYAGDADFDYSFGAAAVDSGKFSEAVFPLQRAVATSPDLSGARLELARAYYGVGDNELARREFVSLKDQRPPPRVEQLIQQYLDAIDRRAIDYQRQATGFAELSGGHDSNANGATESQVFQGFNLSDRSRATSSAYYGMSLGGLYSSPLAPGLRAQLDGQAAIRQVPDAPFVDSNQGRAAALVEWRDSTITVNSALSYAYAELDGAKNNSNVALDLSATLPFAGESSLVLAARHAQLRYVDALALQSVSSNLLSVAVSRPFGGILLSAGLTGGQDDAREAVSPFGRTLAGARVSAFTPMGGGLYLNGTLAALQSDYEGRFFPPALLERKDLQYSAQLGLDWQNFPGQLWGLRTQIGYVNNDSDVAIFKYDRVDLGLALRREFR